MPRHKEVPSLESLSIKSIGTLVVSLSPHILSSVQKLSDPQTGTSALQNNLKYVRELLISCVPYYMYDTVAVEVLKAVKLFIEKTKKTYYPHLPISSFLVEMNVAVSLTEVVLNQHLRKIDFTVWPKIMRYVLYKNLVNLTGLEVLNLGSCTVGWRTSEYDKCIMDGILGMKNLRSICLCFDCTDVVVQLLSENCPHLESLDITSSRSVTDRSVCWLLSCCDLRVLLVHRTSITVVGLSKLLIGLTKLENVGRCDEFGRTMRYLSEKFPHSGPFGLKSVQIRDVCTEDLKLFVDSCPNIEYLSLFHDEQTSDLTVLNGLHQLKEIKLLSCLFYADYLKQFLEIRGFNITSIHLEHVEEIDIDALTYISEYCPLLKNLVLYNCDFLSQGNHHAHRPATNQVKPFQHLERLFWVVDCSITHLEYILSHAVNIKHIHLGSSTGITHDSIVFILRQNPMASLEELRILFSSDMSMQTVQLLLASCTNLKVLSELESWQCINLDELRVFRQHIHLNNFDLDIRPTLSYY